MPMNDQTLARTLAMGAGRQLMALRAEQGFDDPDVLRAAGDSSSHEQLLAALRRSRPDDAVLSEEGADDRARLASPRVWILDPLDGTREFAERGRRDWAVHVALWERGELAAGAVALPAEGTTLTSSRPPRLADPSAARSRPGAERQLRLAVSRTRAPAFIPRLAQLLDAELVPMGSAGAKVAAVLLGRVDVYVHAGGQYEWDSAAPVAVAAAAGAHTSRMDGSPLTYNQPEPKVPDLIVCHPALAPEVLAGVAQAVSLPAGNTRAHP
ncbi:MAG: 3'(2'),5'-bisphosphate nucleotidase CysQ [Streptosporangiaceae bacterium]